ncbi:putative ring-h2 finger protein atl21a [Quercus suber]|uniref:RING-type E3 ubiquitin transferase n=1 Tax=Quercus suber TaxID=58331 RepID=A0AAW0KE09_QUESU
MNPSKKVKNKCTYEVHPKQRLTKSTVDCLEVGYPNLTVVCAFIVDLGEGHNSCPELRCGDDGPPIRFPFRLRDRQPDQHCGNPGFDLYCSHNNDTVLKLPTSVKAFVKHIDYKSQLIIIIAFHGKLRDSIYLPFLSNSKILFLTMPFSVVRQIQNIHIRSIVLIALQPQFLAFPSDYDIDNLPILSCTKMYTVSSVPSDIWSSPSLELTWSGPKCGHCEGKGKICRFENNSTDLKTECFDPDKDKEFYASTDFYSSKVLSYKEPNTYWLHLLAHTAHSNNAPRLHCITDWLQHGWQPLATNE